MGEGRGGEDMKRTKQSTFAKRERSEKSTGFAPVGSEDMTHTTKHTPGPWEVKPIGKQLYVEAKDSQGFVCDMQINDALGETDGPRIRADAHLIAAAPAMYEALRQAYAYLAEMGCDCEEGQSCGDCIVCQCEAALAQADGKQKVS